MSRSPMNSTQRMAERNVAALDPATAGWHEDPWRQHKLRYHDGQGWTKAVTHFGPVPCSGCDHYQN